MTRTVLNESLSNGWNCLNASWSSAFNSRKRFGYAPCCWLLKIHSLAHVFLRLDLLRQIFRTERTTKSAVSATFAYPLPVFVRHLEPKSEIWKSPPSSSLKSREQVIQIFSSRPCVAKFSRKLRRTREETAEQTALPGHLLSCFLSCAVGLTQQWPQFLLCI